MQHHTNHSMFLLEVSISFTNMHAVYYCRFSCIYISQGSVATQLRFGGMFNNRFVAICPLDVTVKKFRKSVNIWRRQWTIKSGTFQGTVYETTRRKLASGLAVFVINSLWGWWSKASSFSDIQALAHTVVNSDLLYQVNIQAFLAYHSLTHCCA